MWNIHVKEALIFNALGINENMKNVCYGCVDLNEVCKASSESLLSAWWLSYLTEGFHFKFQQCKNGKGA